MILEIYARKAKIWVAERKISEEEQEILGIYARKVEIWVVERKISEGG